MSLKGIEFDSKDVLPPWVIVDFHVTSHLCFSEVKFVRIDIRVQEYRC